MTHTSEPWEMAPYPHETGDCGDQAIAISKGRFIAEVAFNDDEQVANAYRVVACVNALAGIDTEALEAAGVGGVARKLAAAEWLAEALAESKRYLELFNLDVPNHALVEGTLPDLIDECERALAAWRGGEEE